MIHIYCGDGKGKTTAAVGLAARAAGSKMKVMFVQFTNTEFSGERNIFGGIENVALTVAPRQAETEAPEEDRRKTAAVFRGIFERSATAALTERYDMIVLDGIFDVINAEMLSEAQVYEFITNAPGSIEIVMTGHDPSKRFLDEADYVTEMKKLKHPFDKGITGRIGIEF